MKPIQTGPQSLRRFLCVTAVVAGLAVGGALTGCGSSRSSLSAGHSPAVLHLGAGGGRGMTAGVAADSKMMQIRPTSYVFDGTAPDLGAAAQAYTVGGQAGSAALVEHYAKAFGLTGTARELAADSGGGWQVGAADYTGPGLAIDWVEVEGPLVESWPPASHRRLFGDLKQTSAPAYNDSKRVEEIGRAHV